MDKIITLDEFIIHHQLQVDPGAGELTGVLRDIGVAAKIINREVNKAGLVNILGVAGNQNESGDLVQKLDIYANEKIIDCLKNSGDCCGIASEENENYIPFKGVAGKDSKFVVLFDPLDGSSNIDVNVSVGTIFSIYKRLSSMEGECTLEDFLQKGTQQVAAGYVLYGTSTILVYTTGKGVNGFTLDPTIGEFCLSHRDIKIPENGAFYSVNQGYYLKFDLEMRRYIDYCSDNNLGLRYIGSMVSDVHRILFQGGIFLYPNTRKYPKGKLRMQYECNPMAFIVEQCGGKAMNTSLQRIMELDAHELHQRSTIVLGSPLMVDEMKRFVEKYSPMI
ncbi:MAG: fructose-1,6-bisphosphatase class 1 [Candidatus Parvibacillus calidus]|nr:MAG: fructose-1,6-bisphosphatase class 1 [Candidatus Parvibacillus calidus]